MEYSYSNWNSSEMSGITISSICDNGFISEEKTKREKIKCELKMMEMAKEIEVVPIEDSTEKYYYFYIVSNEELGNNSIITGDPLYIYSKSKMKPETMKKQYINNSNCSISEQSLNTRFPHSDLLSIVEAKKHFYKVRVNINDITEIEDGIGETKKVKVVEIIDPPKQNDTVSPTYNIKYHIEKMTENIDIDGATILNCTVKLTNPWWNNNSAYIHVSIPKDNLETMFNKECLQKCFLEDLQEAKKYENLIFSIEKGE